MTCFNFDNFNNLLLFVEQQIEQVREEFRGRESWRLKTFSHVRLFHAQFELGPLGCILLTISAVLSRSIEKYDRPCHRCDIKTPPSGEPSAVSALCSVASERIWMCPLPHWSEPTATALRCDIHKSVVNRYVTMYVCYNIFLPLVFRSWSTCWSVVERFPMSLIMTSSWTRAKEMWLSSRESKATVMSACCPCLSIITYVRWERSREKFHKEVCFKNNAHQNLGELGAQQTCQILCILSVLCVFLHI